MISLRVSCPGDLTEAALDLVNDHPGVAHVALVNDAAIHPAGDLLLIDVVREAASDLIDDLEALGVAESGAIVAQAADVALSSLAERAAHRIPGHATPCPGSWAASLGWPA